jgi:hypothetical protein
MPALLEAAHHVFSRTAIIFDQENSHLELGTPRRQQGSRRLDGDLSLQRVSPLQSVPVMPAALF